MPDVGWLTEPLGLVLVGIITVGGSYLTTRASNRASQHVTEETVAGQIETSRIQAEQNAYERAEATLGRTIDRLNSEVAELETDVIRLKARVDELERQLAGSLVERDQLREQLTATQAELAQAYRSIADLRAELEAARVLLARHYPDED